MGDLKGIPKLFKGKFSEKEFRRKILSKLYIHEYRKYINGVFVRDEEGNFKLKENLNKKDTKKLKSIAKSIKSNTGFVLRGKLALIGILLGGILIFNILFMDKLIERAMEISLEKVFEARADVRDLNFEIFDGRIRFKSLEVANSRKPFRNLFELGEVDLHVDLRQLVRSKVVINNLKFQEIRWDTERKTSGALPGREVPVSEGEEEAKLKTFAVAFLEDAEKVVSEIIKKEMENIKSPELLKGLPGKYKDLDDKWEGILNKQRKELKNLPKLVEPVKAIELENIKTAEEAVSAYNMVEGTYKKLKATEEGLIQSFEEFKSDLSMAVEDKRRVENTIQSDYEYLSFFIKSSGKRGEIGTAILDHYVEKYLAEIYDKFRMWNYYFEKLRPMIKRREGKEMVLRDYGRDVTFPSVQMPRFWLKNVDVSIGSILERDLYGVEATDITSNQNIINSPTTFSIERIKGLEEIRWSGLIDRREERDKSAVFDFTAENLTFVLGEGIKALKVSKAKGLYNLDGRISFDKLNRAGGTLSLHLFDIELDLSDKKDRIAVNVKKALSVNPVNVQISYNVSEDGKYSFKIKSNLDELISGIIGGLVTEWVDEMKTKLHAELNNLLKARLEEYEEHYKTFISLEEDFEGDLLDIRTYEQLVEKKKQELQSKIEEKEAEAKEKIEDKAKEELEKIKDKIKVPF
jgi:uncharacterized protein (TIGR03545 family)